MSKTIGAAVVTVACVVMVLTGPSSPAGATEAGDFAAAVNALRASRGVPALALDAELSAVAQAWAEHMAAEGGISHNPDLAGQVTAAWRALGENVGVGGDVPGLMAAFVASPPHFENLVRLAYTHVGVGTVRTDGGTKLWTVHVFMAARGEAPASETAPAPEPEVEPAAEPRARAGAAVEELPPAPVPAAAPPAQAARVATVLAALRAVQG